jgi:hypothetical protein
MSYAQKPIYLFGGTGIILMTISLAVMLFLMVRRLWLGITVFDSPLFFVSVVSLILGFQSILMGLIAELLVRTYHEAQQKPTYNVRRIVGKTEKHAHTNSNL